MCTNTPCLARHLAKSLPTSYNKIRNLPVESFMFWGRSRNRKSALSFCFELALNTNQRPCENCSHAKHFIARTKMATGSKTKLYFTLFRSAHRVQENIEVTLLRGFTTSNHIDLKKNIRRIFDPWPMTRNTCRPFHLHQNLIKHHKPASSVLSAFIARKCSSRFGIKNEEQKE